MFELANTRILSSYFLTGFISILLVSFGAATDGNFIAESESDVSPFRPSHFQFLRRVDRAFDSSEHFWTRKCISDNWANDVRKCPRGTPCDYRKCSSGQEGWEYKCCITPRENLIHIKNRHRTLKYAGDRRKTPVWWLFNRLYFIKDLATASGDYNDEFVPVVNSEEPIQEIDNFL